MSYPAVAQISLPALPHKASLPACAPALSDSVAPGARVLCSLKPAALQPDLAHAFTCVYVYVRDERVVTCECCAAEFQDLTVTPLPQKAAPGVKVLAPLEERDTNAPGAHRWLACACVCARALRVRAIHTGVLQHSHVRGPLPSQMRAIPPHEASACARPALSSLVMPLLLLLLLQQLLQQLLCQPFCRAQPAAGDALPAPCCALPAPHSLLPVPFVLHYKPFFLCCPPHVMCPHSTLPA